MKTTHTIIVECVDLLKVELEKLNKKAKRLGCTELTMTASDPYMKAVTIGQDQILENVVDVVIEGEPVKANGWRFLGRIEAVPGGENLIFTVPGEKAPDEYRTCSPYRCQHCNQERLRKYTWIVEHDDGRHRQVGSSCMDDFLSAKNPERAVAWWMGSMDKLLAYLNDLERKSSRDVATGFHAYVNRAPLINSLDVLIEAAHAVRVRGAYEWPSRDGTVQGTPSLVWQALFATSPFQDGPNDVDRDLAMKVVTFIIARRNTSDYMKNLSVMVLNPRVSVRNLRYICSGLYTYLKAQGLTGKKPTGKNEHFGRVGDRLRDVPLTVHFVLPIASSYHENYDYLILFKDVEGRTFKWKKTSSGTPPKKDDKVILTGTITEHEVYKGVNQTVLQRCALKSAV